MVKEGSRLCGGGKLFPAIVMENRSCEERQSWESEEERKPPGAEVGLEIFSSDRDYGSSKESARLPSVTAVHLDLIDI